MCWLEEQAREEQGLLFLGLQSGIAFHVSRSLSILQRMDSHCGGLLSALCSTDNLIFLIRRLPWSVPIVVPITRTIV